MSEPTTPSEPELTHRVQPEPDMLERFAQAKVERLLFGDADVVRIGRYVLLGLLGSGGFGEVHAAFDPKLNRRVALKLIHSSDRRAPKRMVREAQALARVAHPNVVAIFDFGTFADRSHVEHMYIAMEHVEGQTLRQWLAERPRPWRAVLAVLLAAGRGLEAIHRAGLVHHDFKPGNVLVARDGRVRIVDFGLARIAAGIDAPPEGARHLDLVRVDALAEPSTTAATIGTPVYMAPEQHRVRPPTRAPTCSRSR